ncbi:MAG: 3-dehydroquinate dehydratase [Gammaproteobacteria bacterium]|nr:MAG: 3-dehydroquinate dehydratase [Gammaproteobacteria bacterium]PIE37244.1 MAG: 3-dehydroquinate dehydratase [Gammaproteobacteria bacterium]
MSPGRGATDLLLESLAEHLMARGTRVVGVVQTNTELSGSPLCDMDVRVLPDGPEYRISQSLGPEARGCRLDPVALEASVGEVESRLSATTELLLVNKFGKHEAEGGGFRPTIGRALAMGVPVLVGLNEKNRDAWLAFSDGASLELAPSLDALTAWAETVAGGSD